MTNKSKISIRKVAWGMGVAQLFLIPVLYGFVPLTITPEKFSWSKFRDLAVGSTKEEVVSILGEPFRKQRIFNVSDASEMWFYTKKTEFTFWFRDCRVFFDKYGMVLETLDDISEDDKVRKRWRGSLGWSWNHVSGEIHFYEDDSPSDWNVPNTLKRRVAKDKK